MRDPDTQFWRGRRIVVTGGAGFIGSHLVDVLRREAGVEPDALVVPRSATDDLRDAANAQRVIDHADVVFHLAALSGGSAFSREKPATQYRDATLIDLNVFEACRAGQVPRLVAIGNLFAYGEHTAVPLAEDDLFEGLPGASHRGIGLAKRNLAGLSDLYQREHGLVSTVVYSANAYGPGDSLDRAYGHVIPALILKCLQDRELVVWGDGSPRRDFLYVEDIARGLIAAAERAEGGGVYNIGSNADVSIAELVEHVVAATGFRGDVSFDTTKPSGDARRLADVSRARDVIGFAPRIGIAEGLAKTVKWYRERLGLDGAAGSVTP